MLILHGRLYVWLVVLDLRGVLTKLGFRIRYSLLRFIYVHSHTSSSHPNSSQSPSSLSHILYCGAAVASQYVTDMPPISLLELAAKSIVHTFGSLIFSEHNTCLNGASEYFFNTWHIEAILHLLNDITIP